MTMNTPITFVPVWKVTITTPAGSVAQQFDMPPTDGNAPDVTVTNLSGHPAWLAFGDGARADPEGVGTMVVKGGQSALISASECVSALGIPLVQVNQPNRIHGGPTWEAAWAQNVATATKVSVLTHMSGGVIEITRGTVTPATTF